MRGPRRLRIRPSPAPCSPIAQLAEQRTVNPWVAGSIPARGAILQRLRPRLRVRCALTLFELAVEISHSGFPRGWGARGSQAVVAGALSDRNLDSARIAGRES